MLISQATGCRAGTQVRLVALEHFGHAWPAGDAPYGEPSAYDATAEIGRFFAGLRIRRDYRQSE
jgi:poly(3-hydroxybutyrate) depolymerase